MNRRHFFQLLWGALGVAFFDTKLKSEPSPTQGATTFLSGTARRGRSFPTHECVDRPYLPCPACMKWTGDGFVTVKNNP